MSDSNRRNMDLQSIPKTNEEISQMEELEGFEPPHAEASNKVATCPLIARLGYSPILYVSILSWVY